MKQAINILKEYITCEDPGTRNKFYNLLDSFWHKDEGKVLKQYTVAQNGDINFRFVNADGSTSSVNLPALPNSKPISFIDGLADALGNLVTKVPGKGLSTNDLTTDLLNKLNNLENYQHPEFHQMGEVEGLPEALEGKQPIAPEGWGFSQENYSITEKNKMAKYDELHYSAPVNDLTALAAIPLEDRATKQRRYVHSEGVDYFFDASILAADAEDDFIAPDDQEAGEGFWRKANLALEVSVRDGNDVEQFKMSDFIRFRGVSFDPANNSIQIESVDFNTWFIHPDGDNNTGEFQNPAKPFEDINYVLALEEFKSNDVIRLMDGSTYQFLTESVTKSFSIVSEYSSVLDFTNHPGGDITVYYQYLTHRIIMPKGRIRNNKAGQLGARFGDIRGTIEIDVDVIEHTASNNFFYGEFWNLNIRTRMTASSVFISGPSYMVHNEVRIPRLEIKDNTIHPIGSNQNVTYNRIYGTGGLRVSGGIQFGIGNIDTDQPLSMGGGGSVTVNFLNSTITSPGGCVLVGGNWSGGTITLLGSIKSTPFLGRDSNIWGGNIIFRNFVGNIQGGFIQFYRDMMVEIENCSIKLNDHIVNLGSGLRNKVKITNSVIDMLNPGSLTIGGSNESEIEINGLTTNALSISNSIAVPVINRMVGNKDKEKEKVVRSKIDIINRPLDPAITYIIDGILFLSAGEFILVPEGGLTFTGYGFDVSQITKGTAEEAIFKSPFDGNGVITGSGNFITKDIQYSAYSGKVLDIKDIDGSHAIEMNDVNFVACEDLGKIDSYRQLTATTCGIYECSNGFELEGSWSGFKLSNTNCFGFDAGGTLFRKGANLTFSSRFYLDLNVDLPLGAVLCDFDETNFLDDELFQITNAQIKSDGTTNPNNSASLIPNISANNSKCKWSNSVGIQLSALNLQDIKAPDGTVYRLTVDNSGTLITTPI